MWFWAWLINDSLYWLILHLAIYSVCTSITNYLYCFREEAFKDAIMNAKSKGTLVSKCLGVELGPVVTLTEDSLNERPLPRDQTTAKKHDPDRISESTVVITCNVSAVFELHTVENNKKKS